MKKKKNMGEAITDALGTASNEELLKKERRANSAWSKLKRNKTAMVGLIIVCIMVLIAVFAPLLAPYDPTAISPLEAYALPGENGHILGCDHIGRDLLSRIIYGSRVSLLVAFGGTVVAGIIGVLLGLIAGYFGGRDGYLKAVRELEREIYLDEDI